MSASTADPEAPRAGGEADAASPPDQEAPPPLAIEMPVDVRSAALTVLAVLAVVLVLQYAQAMVIPIVLSVLISYALDPVVKFVQRARVPRSLAAALVLSAAVGSCGWLLYGLRDEGNAILRQLPEAARRVRERVEDGHASPANAIQQVQKAATELERAADTAAPPPARSGVLRVQVEPKAFAISDYLVWGSVSIAAVFGQLVLILFLAYFLLASGDLYRRKLVKIVGPSLSKKKVTVQILEEIDQQIERFLVVQLFTSTIVGVATWLAFRAVGVQQAAVWGALAGVFNSIPYFGPVLVTGGTAVVAFLQFNSFHMAATVAGLSLAITSLEGFLLTPWLTSRAARMNAVAVFVGLLFWGWVWSVWGLLLAVPMLMIVKSVCDRVEDFKGVGELLGD
ncbi:MAG TPA: AI-2E family transporter [Vicinamibacterales bacterium]|jgi:predicted PurR-regulated permease PerM|nr:AI-2E family transporter [Vicinamibacterales bacterium]